MNVYEIVDIIIWISLAILAYAIVKRYQRIWENRSRVAVWVGGALVVSQLCVPYLFDEYIFRIDTGRMMSTGSSFDICVVSTDICWLQSIGPNVVGPDDWEKLEAELEGIRSEQLIVLRSENVTIAWMLWGKIVSLFTVAAVLMSIRCAKSRSERLPRDSVDGK
jgi:hypothetical protein